MANERDDQFASEPSDDQQPAGQRSQQNELGNQGQRAMSNQGSEDSLGDESSGNGQPIGGNDSNAGSGTTLSQGADFGGQSSNGQARTSEDRGDALTADDQSRGSVGEKTTSNAGASSVGTDQTSSGSSGTSGGHGFIGSSSSESGDYLQEGSADVLVQGSSGGTAPSGSDTASADATGGSDFAPQGQGALDDEDDESNPGSIGSASSGAGAGSI